MIWLGALRCPSRLFPGLRRLLLCLSATKPPRSPLIAVGIMLWLLQELLKDSIQVLRQKCDSMIAEVEAFEAGVDFDEAMP